MKAAEFFDGELLTDVTREMWPFRQQIADREHVLAALALARQHRVARANSRLERAFIDGIGEVVASIDADVYHRLGLIYGYETVNSDDFLRCLLRDNPDLRVKSRSRKTGIVVPCDWRDGDTGDGIPDTGERAGDFGSRISDCGLGGDTPDFNGGGVEVCTEGAAFEDLREEEEEDEDEEKEEEVST